MAQPPPFLFSLLNLPLLTGMIIFIMARRPREPLTWAFAGIMGGLIVFYLADVVLFRPGLSLDAGLDWQYIQIQGANLTILSALFLNFWLRDKRLQRWEWCTSGFIVLRMAIVMMWQFSLLRPAISPQCLSLYGLPRISCSPIDRWVSITDAIAGICVAVLFFSTALQAAEPKRQILRRYIVWATALIVGGSTSLQILTLTGKSGLGVITGQPATLLAILIGLRLFLALEEVETEIRFPILGWRVIVWLVLVLVAMMVDLTWGWLNAPVCTLLVLAVGVAGTSATLVNSLVRHAATSQPSGASSPALASAPADTGTSVAPLSHGQEPLRLCLLGPMQVVRNGDTLSNTADVWRSAKTRSLLALLALYSERGATQVEIVDALWPLSESLSREELGKAEQQSLTNLRSYLSTLRHVLEPDGPRGSDRYVELIDGRYRLRRDSGIWVDVWQFEALATQAEKHRAAGRTAESIAGWEEAIALYPAEGLLPTERYLSMELIEAQRERLRQRCLLALRRLIQHYAEHGPAERAAELQQRLREIESMGAED